MNKILLYRLVKLYALISVIYARNFVDNVKLFIQAFLKKEFSVEILSEYLINFNQYFNEYLNVETKLNDKTFRENQVSLVTEELKNELKNNPDNYLSSLKKCLNSF